MSFRPSAIRIVALLDGPDRSEAGEIEHLPDPGPVDVDGYVLLSRSFERSVVRSGTGVAHERAQGLLRKGGGLIPVVHEDDGAPPDLLGGDAGERLGLEPDLET